MNWQSIKNTFLGRNTRASNFLYGGVSPKALKRIKIAVFFLLMSALIGGWFIGYIHGYTSGTGTPPFMETVVIVPDVPTEVTEEEAEQVVEDNPVDVNPYEWGNNCWDIALDAVRHWEWEGCDTYLVALDFGNSEIGHTVVGIPTTDGGWKYYDPGSGTWISPKAGGFWMGNLIVGIYASKPEPGYMLWNPIDVLETPEQ